MNTTPFPSLTPRELVRLLVAKRALWIAPSIACGLLAAAYSLVMPRYWEASQALVVRQETAGSRGPTPGKFADLYEMRTMQETILELAKSRQVVARTIKAADERTGGAAKEPSAEDVEKFRKRLKMLPPDGGEFGKTEVFYLCVKDPSRRRAMELVAELCRQLDRGLKELRTARAKNLIAELQQEVAAAVSTLDRDTKRLSDFEAQVGGDLGELRMLHSASSGQSDLRQEAVQLEADHRKYETQLRQTEQLLELLRAAEQDPQQLVATPNSLLASQPALRRLKDGLVDAQLASARLAGTRSADHPRVKAAAEAEKQIRADLHEELVAAIGGAEVELRLEAQRLATTDARRKNLDGRLDRLAAQRAEYSNRVAAVESSRLSLDQARQNLNTAIAAEAAAHSGSLVTRLDQPETGPYPVGPGRTVIAAAGAVGGLMLGLGWIFLTTGMPTGSTSAASSDQRSADLQWMPGERATEPPPAAPDHSPHIAAAMLQPETDQPSPADAATTGAPGARPPATTEQPSPAMAAAAAAKSPWQLAALEGVRKGAAAVQSPDAIPSPAPLPTKGPLAMPRGALPGPVPPLPASGAWLQDGLSAVHQAQP